MPKLLTFLFVLSSTNGVLSYVYNGLLLVETSGETEEHCISFATDSAVPKSLEDAKFHYVANIAKWEACEPLGNRSVEVAQQMVMVGNGTCTTLRKTYIAQNEDAAGILIVQTSQNKTKPGPYKKPDNFSIAIPVVFISQELGETLAKYGSDVKVAVYDPPLAFLDWILVVMWFTAVFCLAVGSYWNGVGYYAMVSQQLGCRRSQVTPESAVRSHSNPHTQTTYISIAFVVALVVMMCGFLLLLYFFYNYLVFGIIGLFFIASSTSMFIVLDNLTHLIFPCKPWHFPEFRLCGVTYRIEFTQVLLAVACYSFGAFWVYIRNQPHAWILQDILGVFFCINVLRFLRLPNMMIVTTLLVLLFFYDIFFVFITPFFTSSKKSIMVDVATGGESSNGEKLPLVFKFPHVYSGPFGQCLVEPAFSVLGFGDILIPGLAVSFVHGFDLEVKSKRVYFISSVIAYGVGLLLTFMGLALIQGAQPALLYLVPCLLLTIFGIALIRHEVKALWRGEAPPETERDQAAEERLPAVGTPTQDTSESPSSSGFPSTSETTEERRLINRLNT